MASVHSDHVIAVIRVENRIRSNAQHRSGPVIAGCKTGAVAGEVEAGVDGRISFRDLGLVVNLSSNAPAERVERMRQRGVITGFAAQISPNALGLPLHAFIDLKLQPGTSVAAFEEALPSMELVREAMSLIGAFDVRIRVACKDTPHLGQIIEKLRAVPGVQETNSSMICRPLKITNPSRRVATKPAIRRRMAN